MNVRSGTLNKTSIYLCSYAQLQTVRFSYNVRNLFDFVNRFKIPKIHLIITLIIKYNVN